MKDRRSLVEGLSTAAELDKVEEEFVFGGKRKTETDAEIPSRAMNQAANPKVLPQMVGRIPVTARCHPDIASALKRASLQRNLAGIEPYHVQDIVEEALELWLRQNGYVA